MNLTELHNILLTRFNSNQSRHKDVDFGIIWEKLTDEHKKSLLYMEITGGEPDLVLLPNQKLAFVDLVKETPDGRRGLCYDKTAREERTKFPPPSSALEEAAKHNIKLLNEEEYHFLQTISVIDTKTSSWLLTPTAIRKEGGAIFGDYRYGRTFIYHNGADSYYAVRGFRAKLELK